jgi:hypothetical protein
MQINNDVQKQQIGDVESMICVEYINITCNIESIKDIMALCNTYKVAENVRYNIDIAKLNKIYPYLKELDNMIGMQSIKSTLVDQVMYFIQNLHVLPDRNQIVTTQNQQQQHPEYRATKTKNTLIPIHISGGTTPPAQMNLNGIPNLFYFNKPTDTVGGGGGGGAGGIEFINDSSSSSSSSSTNIFVDQKLPNIASIFANMQMPKLSTKRPSSLSSSASNSNSNQARTTGDFMHTVLCGPPGTGKTEVAKILGNIFSHLGILKSGTFKKVTRSDLIAGYLGQTAIKTREIINSAIGGVLFIDEAYALGNTEKRDSFSKECLDTLCEALSDHKHELMVIIAGYEKELNDCFFSYNEGLNSRFTWRYNIDSYNATDLRKIFEKIVRDNNWTFEERDSIKDVWFKANYDYFKYFGRDIEVFFTKTKIAHSRRIFCNSCSNNDPRYCITMNDLDSGFALFLQNADVKMRGNKFDCAASTLYL